MGSLWNRRKAAEAYWLLYDRQISVCSNKLSQKLTLQKVTSGVPQGSILGPLFFLMFINDLPDTMPQADSFGYADDYNATFGAQSGLDRAVDALGVWPKENTMSVNISKAYIMKLRGRMAARLNKKCLPVTRSLKNFGRTVNDSLNWTDNGRKRCSKELSALFQLRRNLGEKTH